MENPAVPQPQPESHLDQALRQVQDAILAGVLTPENPEARVNLLEKLTNAVSELAEPPQTSERAVDRVANLLWYKSHPSQLDPYDLAKALTDSAVAVRLAAADLMTADLAESPERWKNPVVAGLASIVLQRQIFGEPSPALAMQQTAILKQLSVNNSPRIFQTRPLANPYIAGFPVREAKKFYDRESILERIRDSFTASGCRVIVHGGRRTGKTSLLYKLEEYLGPDFLAVYLDMQACSGEPLERFLAMLANAIRAAAKKARPQRVPKALTGEVTCEALGKMLDSLLDDSSGNVVLLLDEYEVLTEFFSDLATARQITALFDNRPRLFGVFAGEKLQAVRDVRHLGRLLDTALPIEITFLNEADARRLATEPAAGALVFEESSIQRLYALCHGHPFYTQLLCQSIFDEKKGSGTVTIAEVQSAVNRFVLNPAPHLILSWTNDLSLAEKLVASVLAQLSEKKQGTVKDILAYLRRDRYPIRLGETEAYGALSSLQRMDWLKKGPGSPDRSFRESVRFEFTMDLLPSWIREYSPAWNLLEEQRDKVTSLSASPGARLGAAGIDLLVVVMLTVGALYFHTPLWIPLGLCAVYYGVTVIFCDGTPGMRLATRSHLTVVSEVGQPLGLVRASLLAALLAIPSALISAGLWLTVTQTRRVWGIVLMGAGLVLDIVHQLMMRKDRDQKRGIFDRWSRAVVISDAQEVQ